MVELKKQYNRAAKDLGLAVLHEKLPVIYQLRHGRASHELATGRRNLTDIMSWKSQVSVKRYEKGGRLAEILERLPPDLANLAEKCQSNIGAILCGTCPPFLHTTASQSPSSSSQDPAGGRRRTDTRPRARMT